MATIKYGNYSFREPPFQDGDRIEGGNYSQLQPQTEICKDVKDLVIFGGNFVNVKLQPSWKRQGGNWAQISRCSHLHPDWIEKGLSLCAVDCKHRISAKKSWVEVEKQEFRQLKESARLGQEGIPKLIVDNEMDQDGIIEQKLQKEVFVYQDKVL